MIAALVLVILLVLSVLLNFSQFASSIMPVRVARSRTVGPRFDEAILKDNGASSKILVIDVDGIITGRALDQSGYSMVDVIKDELERAEEDDRVKAVLLRVDSPGGEVLASDEIYRALVNFQKSSRKPVVTSMGDLAASGGYYISSASRWIVANEMTITGSIGVIMHTWNYRGLMDKVGVAPMVFKSGKFKDMLSGERSTNEIPAEERVMVQSLIEETYARFTNVVAQGRSMAHEKNEQEGRNLANDWSEYADGRVLSGSKAFELGFVDELGNFDDAVKRARELAGIRNANLIQYQLRYDISDLFRLFGKSEPSTIKVDLGMDTPKLQAGQLYFLSPTFLR